MFKCQKICTLVVGASNIKFYIFASGDDLVDGWKEGRMDGMIWKDGTKMDNGICIQTIPTRN